MEKSGIEGTGNAKSQSWLNWEGSYQIEEPAFGAIAVFTNKSNAGQGHVTFVGGQTTDGRLLFLGGNQSDMVNYSTTWINKTFRGYFYPNGFTPNYNLPIINNYRRAGGTR